MSTIILDPGHGMSNRKSGVYDPGACSGKIEEATVALDWVNELRAILQKAGHKVVRTRVDATDPAPVSRRASIAKEYKGEVMLSIHCNAANGKAGGSECIYRGDKNKAKAITISKVCSTALGIKDRGPKVEADSQHGRLAVMAFQPCFLLEIGFIDNAGDRAAVLDPAKRKAACEAIAKVLI
jgi:N-acetylmuramoyl-L-alanine amidase